MTLQDAIAHQEGFDLLPDSPDYPCPAQRNHNPGNIIWGTFAKLHGAVKADDEYRAVFPDDATGQAALTALLQSPLYRGKTVEAAINEYCPPANGSALTQGNDPDAYVRDVCAWVPCTPDTIIDGLLGL